MRAIIMDSSSRYDFGSSIFQVAAGYLENFVRPSFEGFNSLL